MDTNMLDENEFRELIIDEVNKAGSQKALAEAKGINQSVLSDILNGRRDISDAFARAFGRRLVKFYVTPQDSDK